jgi:hypothetical protein
MSAFVVGNDHIAAMTELAVGRGASTDAVYWDEKGDGVCKRIQREDFDRIGQLLLDENVRSVNYRYKADDVGVFVDPPYLQGPTAVEGLSMVVCYQYQSCETPDWEQSAAYRLCEAIIHKLIRHLPGYDDAPWEWKGPAEKRYSLMDMASGRY